MQMVNSRPSLMRRIWFPWGLMVALYCGYIALARAGLIFASTPANVTPVWPLSGIVLGILLRLRLRFWYIIWLADFSVALWLKNPPLVAAGIASATTIEAIVGAALILSIVGAQPTLTRLREVLSLIGCTAVVAIPLGASISTLSLVLGQRVGIERAWEIWQIWYVGDLMGILTITPTLLTWVVPLSRPFKFWRTLEVTLSWALLVGITWFVFRSQLDYVFLLFPMVIWAALRFTPRGAASFLLTVCLIAIWHTAHGSGPFAQNTLTQNLLFLQIFLGVLSGVTMVLSALISERDQRNTIQQFFASFSSLLNPSIDETTLLKRTTTLVAQTFADCCIIDIVDPDTSQLKRFIAGCEVADQSESGMNFSNPPTLDTEHNQMLQRIFVMQRPYYTHEITSDVLSQLVDASASTSLDPITFQSIMMVPLSHKTSVLGYIVLATTKRMWRYDASDLVFAQTLAERLSDFIVSNRQLTASREQQKFEALGRLAGNVAHDFNNLLTAINSSAELALMTTKQPLVRDELQHILGTTKRAYMLTRQILAFARQHPYEPVATSINELIEGLVPLIQRLMRSSITVNVELAADKDNVLIDSHQFEQVMTNLVVNARDAMPDGGFLTITTQTMRLQGFTHNSHKPIDDEYVAIRISDTGNGMDDATRARIFEPFFTTKSEGHGTGLGLAMCYSFMQQVGGSISVASEHGQGSTFTLTIPLLQQLDASVPTTAPFSSEQSGEHHAVRL